MNRNTPGLNDVVAKAVALPSAPWLLPKLMELLANPESAADQVENLIRMDSGLATGTLRLANSAYFTNSMPCDTLSDAIVRLGFREIYRLASTKIASGWLNAPVEGYGWEPGDLYRHSLTVAVAGDLLAKETGLVEPEIVYTAGLLHDVGKLALAFACSPQFETIRQYQAKERCAWRAAELQVLGYDHTDVSEALLSTWKFPANLVQVVKFYPRPAAAGAEFVTLVTHVHAAKHLALCLGTGVGEDGFQSEIDEQALRAANISPGALERLLPAVHEVSAKLLHSQTAA
jgi:putative nucleotidyltransferase with HDIG domain